MIDNLMRLAVTMSTAGGVPAHVIQCSEWDAGRRGNFANPEHR